MASHFTACTHCLHNLFCASLKRAIRTKHSAAAPSRAHIHEQLVLSLSHARDAQLVVHIPARTREEQSRCERIAQGASECANAHACARVGRRRGAHFVRSMTSSGCPPRSAVKAASTGATMPSSRPAPALAPATRVLSTHTRSSVASSPASRRSRASVTTVPLTPGSSPCGEGCGCHTCGVQRASVTCKTVRCVSRHAQRRGRRWSWPPPTRGALQWRPAAGRSAA
jgi:hypothetical protein